MSKKDFASDLQNFVKKGEPGTEVPAVETPEREKAIEKETPRSVGRPDSGTTKNNNKIS